VAQQSVTSSLGDSCYHHHDGQQIIMTGSKSSWQAANHHDRQQIIMTGSKSS
jgi:hypothetical protein